MNEEEEEEEVDKPEKEKPRRTSRDKRKNSVSEEASETLTTVTLEGEAKKGGFLIVADVFADSSLSSGTTFSLYLITDVCVFFVVVFLPIPLTLLSIVFPSVTPSDSLVRRSISQQKSGVSVTIDDPVRAAKQPSPPRGKASSIVHLTNLVSL